VLVTAGGDDSRKIIERIFRASAVPFDDPSTRSAGTHGQTLAEPGDIEWFRAAALARGSDEGLAVRFVTDAPGGWDPAMDPQTYGWAGRKRSLPRER
jgi:hypothetical protein